MNQSTDGVAVLHWGISTDVLTPADYDGDGKADTAIFRANDSAGPDFYILNSSDFSVSGYAWGSSGDIASVGDFDGDDKADVAIFRPSDSNFYILGSTEGLMIKNSPGTIPAVGDYDGDGKSDTVTYTNGEWNGTLSSGFTFSRSLGVAGDIPVQGDYDGDRTDVAVFRPSKNLVFMSSLNQRSILSQVVTSSCDYDGDGVEDQAVYRGGQWWVNGSTSGVTVQSFGLATDKPAPASANP